jgi:6-phosphogluconolactonase (cycloisomerase 2 family)
MRRIPSQLALVATAFACMLALVACGSSAPVLQYVTISPTTATISVGTTQQFTASAYYSDGSIKDGTSLVTWGSSPTTVATIDAGGVATGVAAGSATVTAMAAGTPGASATLSVTQLTSMTVTPSSANVAAGNTQQFTATGKFRNPDGTTRQTDVTSLAKWTSAATAVATIDNTGRAAAVASGTSLITASLFGVSASTNIVVGPPAAVSLQVTPAAPSVAVGNALTFSVQELFSDGSLHPFSGTVTWSSDAVETASILAGSGISAAHAAGTANITATEGALTGTTVLSVVAGKAHYAYVNGGASSAKIAEYSVDISKSAPLVSIGTVPQAPNPSQAVLHPSGKYLYATDLNSPDCQVWVYEVNSATGAVTRAGTPPFSQVPAGKVGLNYATIDPYGRFLYVVSGSAATISTFQISQTDGSLTAVTGSPFSFATFNGPGFVITDHTGAYLYVVSTGNNTVSAFSIDQKTGAPTPLSTPTFATGASPIAAAFDPSGTHLYVADAGPAPSGPGLVTEFAMDPTTGLLTSIGADKTVTGGTNVINLTVDPSGSRLYVLDRGTAPANGQVFAFSIGTGGFLGSAIGSTVATGRFPRGIAIDPTGVLLAVDNAGDGTNSGSISLFSVGSDGALTAKTPVAAGVNAFHVIFYDAP